MRCSCTSAGRVVYGCGNERFGGNGSVLTLHSTPSADGSAAAAASPSSAQPALLGAPYPSTGGVLAAAAVDVLKRFYARGNQSVPIEKRHRKGLATAAAAAAQSVPAMTPNR